MTQFAAPLPTLATNIGGFSLVTQSIAASPLGTLVANAASSGTQPAISASLPVTIAGSGTPTIGIQLPTTPAEILATLVSAAVPAPANAGSPKGIPNAPLAASSDSSDSQPQTAGGNLISRIGAVFESLASPSTRQPVSPSTQSIREASGKISGVATKPEIAQPTDKLDSAVTRGVAVTANDSSTLGAQRAISDARTSLAQQFQTKLEGALNAPAPAAPSIPAPSVAPAPHAANTASGQSNTTANPENPNQRKGSDGTNDDSGTESFAASANPDMNEALKSSGLLGSSTVPLLHGAPEAPGQPAGAAVASAADFAANATDLNPSSSAKNAAPLPLAPPPDPPAFAGDAVKASELYQRVDASEMHVAMQTDLLGSVDLRATMHQSALTATISVQRSDVQALLVNELPALQHALADRNLHVEQISVLNNSVNDRTGAGGQQHQPNSNSPKTSNLSNSRAGQGSSSEDAPEARISSHPDARTASRRSTRLSVHA